MKKKLICITGPTASGKTALSIDLAKHYQTEIISADSRQFYKEMKIGTAVPDDKELAAVLHHFIQHKSIFDEYSVGDFEKDFLALSAQLFQKNDILILVGGSGLFIDAATKGLDNLPGKNWQIRKELEQLFKEKGIESLQKKMKELDPEYYARMDIQNPHRLIRSIEILLQSSGKKMKELRVKKGSPRAFDIHYFALNMDRNILYERINRRVDIMMEQGLLEEARNLMNYRHLNPLNTVGYKELFRYFDNEISLENAVEEIKKNTRRFAKRQLTWFRKNKEIKWLESNTALDEIIGEIKE